MYLLLVNSAFAVKSRLTAVRIAGSEISQLRNRTDQVCGFFNIVGIGAVGLVRAQHVVLYVMMARFSDSEPARIALSVGEQVAKP
ncbi:hypothetical protein G6M86_29185 (plasmid) [Agrobacterium tumefaciens]|uniref:Uncharacterized protein n=1 Tax=Agrobacterium tumefaciens TaxID=358 RepID=A0AAJ4N9I0_AGRTU|nr:hypothetical protein G6M86_29185 [Agrobacterium tumefaciens]